MSGSAVAHAIERAEASGLNAVLAWSRERLEAHAASLRPGPLGGLAVAVKDNICTLDFPTTCGSRMLAGYRSPFEATAVARLRAAGAVIAAKTNLDEFAMGSSTEHSAFGRTRHPLDPARVPGGSSGGSAALVAAGAVPAALGSDTGGSVRQPAAFCGVVGVKPTYGRVSRFGLVAFASSLDQIGVLARDTATAAAVLGVISGPDPRDATCAGGEPIQAPRRRDRLDGMVVGVPREYFPPDLDPGVRSLCDRALAALRDLGAAVHEISLPHTGYATPAYYVLAPAEAASNLARYDGARYGLRRPGADARALYRATRGAGFGPEVRRRVLIGTFVLSGGHYEAYYGRAQRVRARVVEDFRGAFAGGCDVLFTPTAPTTAFRAGEKLDDPLSMYRADVFVVPASLAGVPAISIPIGQLEGLPVGGQLIGPAFADTRLLEIAGALERAGLGTLER